MNNTPHTPHNIPLLPLPLSVHELPDAFFLQTNHKWALRGPSGERIAKIEGMGSIPKARADFVMRAVNSHADLVTALKSAEGALGIARNVMGVHELQDSRWDTARTIAEKTINEIRIALENLR